MLASLIAQQLAPCLGTIQKEPISIGAANPIEAVRFQGRTQPMLTPLGLKSILIAPSGPLQGLQSMRDTHLNKIYALFKSNGTLQQRAFIDRYATSQTQVRSLSQSLLNQLSSFTADDPANAVAAAAMLLQMNVTPVVVTHIPFGGDNHYDAGLKDETAAHVAGVPVIAQLMTSLAAAGLKDKVTFATMNVFGRMMNTNNTNQGVSQGVDGRQHNGNHHCTVMIGKNIKSAVIGGVAPMGQDYGATAIDSATGKSSASGDIPFTDTLACAGKTLAVAVGVDPAVVDDQIKQSKALTVALA
jgi:hypothetical protein